MCVSLPYFIREGGSPRLAGSGAGSESSDDTSANGPSLVRPEPLAGVTLMAIESGFVKEATCSFGAFRWWGRQAIGVGLARPPGQHAFACWRLVVILTV